MGGADDVAALERPVILRADQVVASPMARSFGRAEPRRGPPAQQVGVEAGAVADAPGAGAAVADVDGDRVGGVAWGDPHRHPQHAAFVPDLDQVAVLDLERLGRVRRDQRGVVPGQLGHRLGHFLQPAVVGEAAVVDGGVAAEVDLGAGHRRRRRRQRRGQVAGQRHRLRRERGAGNEAVVQPAAPAFSNAAGSAEPCGCATQKSRTMS